MIQAVTDHRPTFCPDPHVENHVTKNMASYFPIAHP